MFLCVFAGLAAKILCNGISAIVFTVFWKWFTERWNAWQDAKEAAQEQGDKEKAE